MPLFQGFCPVAGTICPSLAAAVVGPSRAPQGMKKGRRPRRRPRLKLSDKAGPDQCPVPGENALFPAQIAGFLAVSRAVPVYPVFLNYVVPVQLYSAYKKNPQETFSLGPGLYDAQLDAHMALSQGKARFLLDGNGLENTPGVGQSALPALNPTKLSAEYPIYAPSLFELVQNTEQAVLEKNDP